MRPNYPPNPNNTLRDRLLDFAKLKFELRDLMRYDDVGDYFENTIVSYDMNDDVINNAIMIHEFVEYLLIKSAGLTPEMIDKFDNDWDFVDEHPEEYKLYEKFHRMANKVERQFIENLGLNWESHEKIINTIKVKVAVQNVIRELHKPHPSPEKIEKQKQIVQDILEDSTNNTA